MSPWCGLVRMPQEACFAHLWLIHLVHYWTLLVPGCFMLVLHEHVTMPPMHNTHTAVSDVPHGEMTA